MCMQVLLQTRALGLLPASDSSVIVATEPLWAAGFASLLLGEVLDSSAQLGGLLILLGCLSNTLLSDDLGINFGAEQSESAPRESVRRGLCWSRRRRHQKPHFHRAL